jgi:hypothetical protein
VVFFLYVVVVARRIMRLATRTTRRRPAVLRVFLVFFGTVGMIVLILLVVLVLSGQEVVPVQGGRHVEVPAHRLEDDPDLGGLDEAVRVEPGLPGDLPQHPDQVGHAPRRRSRIAFLAAVRHENNWSLLLFNYAQQRPEEPPVPSLFLSYC